MVIDNVTPQVDCGAHRAKGVIGRDFEVTAEVFHHGHDKLRALLLYKAAGDSSWSETPMTDEGEYRWSGSFRPDRLGRFAYSIEAWPDRWGTWAHDLRLKVEAGQDVRLELAEGVLLLESHVEVVPETEQRLVHAAIKELAAAVSARRPVDKMKHSAVKRGLDNKLDDLLHLYPDRRASTVLRPALEAAIDRERAEFGAWYEFFPRSTGTISEHGTFATASRVLSDIASMGFDVVYLPPIHPIGSTNRKGKNNALTATATDVGSPWAIGSEAGGHDAIHPELGTIDDLDAFVKTADANGLEVALDFAIQCSPDHPWVTEHPDWFHQRPDGSIQYAENPPKKYQDVYPVNFECSTCTELWSELRRIVDYWISHGVKIFRVDNPHTKPLAFWEWLIESIHEEHPDVVFLAEAFTEWPMMRALSKLGFNQSYTYFTWVNTKKEITDYMNELTTTEMAHYYRPNFFTNTPDILHEYLQGGGPRTFEVRLVLASTLSPSYGIYSGFEFLEKTPAEKGSEEYLDSEKYELRPRAIGREGDLVPLIKQLNEIRNTNDHFSLLTNLAFHETNNEDVIAYTKTSPSGADPILVVVNLKPSRRQRATIELELDALKLKRHQDLVGRDLITGDKRKWRTAGQKVNFEKGGNPAHLIVMGN